MKFFTTLTRPTGTHLPAPGGGTGDVRQALQQASRRTGVDFDYLLGTAQRESGLNTTAKAPTSSARGLFQFIESTWLATVRDAGSALGYAEYAEKIGSDRSGRPVVKDQAARDEILRLRDDPQAAAMMAAALAQQNADAMSDGIGRTPTRGELYIAHFLGSKGAVDLVRLADRQPGANAAEAFPQAAKANHTIFYAPDGRPRSASEVYQALTQLPQAVAATGEGGDAEPVSPPAGHGLFTARNNPSQPFHSMFSDVSRGMGPIAGAVTSMWRSEGHDDTASAEPAEAVAAPQPSEAARLQMARLQEALARSDGKPLPIGPDGQGPMVGGLF
ncbi:transglycosylase SLT domain-containing protein [Lutibaculum baratangense]|uniref:Transglycosylase SLT domain-containing protein n=1 Tax=Lutibaculum baratangense AMV1 TaxID=631454 RepID=V4RAN0_9HYPH|nr:transglycosylase SLT domain-containing protein [Lutibaculum baratangense]ESR22434.1 hypothetical protein N177_4164 [Lutibaculum baratangense AMV1]